MSDSTQIDTKPPAALLAALLSPAIRLPEERDMPATSTSFPRWLVFFLKPYWKIFAGFSLLRVMRFTVLSMLPLMIGLTVDAFEQGWAYEDVKRLLWTIGPFMAIYGLANLSILLFMFEAAAEDRFVRGMTLFSVRHMNRLPLNWHEEQGSGSKLQRVMTARTSLKQLYNIYKWSLVPFIGGVVAIILSVAAIKAPAYFFLLFFGFTVTFITAATKLAKTLSQLHDRHNKTLEQLMARVYEFVSAVRTVKAFNMESHIEEQARTHESEGHRAWRKVVRAISVKWTVLNMVGYVWLMAFVGGCIYSTLQGDLSAGGFATVFFLAYQFWTRLEEMVYIQDEFIQHKNGFMRLTETLKATSAPVDIQPLVPFPQDWRDLHFKDVHFGYQGSEQVAIHDINLSIKRGERVALVGRSGAGKSTFVKLMMKQMLPDAGKIALDDKNLSHIAAADWLARIGLVPQDVELFNMSIRENILLDRLHDTSEDAYERALEQAALRELIASLPEGDATLVGERGIKLSGGQRQRLGIARALVRDSDVIVFDEATSALDSLSERVIQHALENAFSGRTILVIAHRLSTVRFTDRIIVLDEGRVIEDGHFETLIENDGAFAKMWRMQSSGFEDRAGF